ncbi:hypothetical protein C0Q70_20245 [Pomacea canaliculata]|uniref:Uncharacterized protein n=2 Tax=Pomacea canaliculata TaxID=400727 RepID=A0A2T7NF08_POMCA|nr:hypothetical protein C0Q70_20245 [Pomacea canaliculata]
MSSGDVQSQAPSGTTALYAWSDAATRQVACTPQTQSTVVTMAPDVLTSFLTLPSVVWTNGILGTVTVMPNLTVTMTMTYPTVLVTCLPFVPQVSVVANGLSCPIAPNVSSFNDLSGILNLLSARNIHSVLPLSGLNQTVQDMAVLLNALLNNIVNEQLGGAVNDLVNGTIHNLGLMNVKDLAVNHTTVSRARRKKESAPDQRPSAQSLGISAICLLFCIMLCIIFFDLPVLYRGLCPRRPDERAALRRQTQVM